MGSVSRAHPGADTPAWLGYLADPEVRIVTLTVTEAGYVRGSRRRSGRRHGPTSRATWRRCALDLGGTGADHPGPAGRRAGRAPGPPAPVRSRWSRATTCPRTAPPPPAWSTEFADAARPGPGRLDQRQRLVRHHHGRPDHPGDHRRTTSDAAAELTGRADAAPVVTEPFTEWVLSGDFPAGRPAWEDAGARFVDDITPFEERKLWLLNGAHSLLAYAGSARGHQTIAEAVTDPVCRRLVEQWWAEASDHLTLPAQEVADYREALVRAVRQPADPAPAGADRRRRLPETARPDPADHPPRTRGRAGCPSARCG